MVVKDDLRRELLARRPAATVRESRDCGRQAVRRLLTTAGDLGEGVLDSVWVDREGARATPAGRSTWCRWLPPYDGSRVLTPPGELGNGSSLPGAREPRVRSPARPNVIGDR